MNKYQFTNGNWCWAHQRYCVYADNMSGRCTGNVGCPHEPFTIASNRTLTDEELKKIEMKLDEGLE